MPESPLLQKRAAEYKVQELVMGVEDSQRPYNSASLSASVPNKEMNQKRAIPVEKVQIRKMDAVRSDESVAETTSDKDLEFVLITNFEERKSSIYNLKTEVKTPVTVCAETVKQYFGNVGVHPSDVTMTLQGT